MSATIACTRCGRSEGLVGATFRDERKQTRAALACRFCALLFPQGLPAVVAAELIERHRDEGVTIEEARR